MAHVDTLCLATFAAYGACVESKGHTTDHRDAFGYTWPNTREGIGTTRDEYTRDGWACVDCYVLLANGDGPTDKTEAELESYDQAIALNTAGFNITMGMLAEEHACATNYTVIYAGGVNRIEVRADSAEEAMELAGGRTGIRSVIRHEYVTVPAQGGDCDCEIIPFYTGGCDVCGSNLGGERHAVSFWKILPEEPATV